MAYVRMCLGDGLQVAVSSWGSLPAAPGCSPHGINERERLCASTTMALPTPGMMVAPSRSLAAA